MILRIVVGPNLIQQVVVMLLVWAGQTAVLCSVTLMQLPVLFFLWRVLNFPLLDGGLVLFADE